MHWIHSRRNRSRLGGRRFPQARKARRKFQAKSGDFDQEIRSGTIVAGTPDQVRTCAAADVVPEFAWPRATVLTVRSRE